MVREIQEKVKCSHKSLHVLHQTTEPSPASGTIKRFPRDRMHGGGKRKLKKGRQINYSWLFGGRKEESR